MDLTYLFLVCVVLSSLQFSNSIAERSLRSTLQFLKPVKTRRQNVNQDNCLCFQEKPTSLTIQAVLDPEGTKNLARLVVFLYKDLNTNEVYVYTPGASKQNQIPNPPYDHEDNLSQSVNQKVVDIFNVNPNVIPMPKKKGHHPPTQQLTSVKNPVHTQVLESNSMYPHTQNQYQNHYQQSNPSLGLLPGGHVKPQANVGADNPLVYKIPNVYGQYTQSQSLHSSYPVQATHQIHSQPAQYHAPQLAYHQLESSENHSKSPLIYQAQPSELLEPPQPQPLLPQPHPPPPKPQTPQFQPALKPQSRPAQFQLLPPPHVANAESEFDNQSSESQSNEYTEGSASAHQKDSSELANSVSSISSEPQLNIPQVQAYPKLNQNQESQDVPHLHPYTGLHLADKGVYIKQGAHGQDNAAKDGNIVRAISNLPTYGQRHNDTGIYYTFDKWLHEQLNKVYKEQMIQSNTINLALLKKHIEKTLAQNGMTLKNGVVLDQQGNALDMTNLKLRPILIGETVGYNNLIQQKVGEDQVALPSNLPYLESMLVSLVDPPNALGIIPLGKVFLPRVSPQPNVLEAGGTEATNVPSSSSLQEIASHLNHITGSPEVESSELPAQTEPSEVLVSDEKPTKPKWQPDLNQPQVEADTATSTLNRRKVTHKQKPKVFTLRNSNSVEKSRSTSSRRRLPPSSESDELLNLVVPNPLNLASSLVNTRRFPYDPRFYGISSFVPEFRIIGGNAATSSGMPINIKGRKTGFMS